MVLIYSYAQPRKTTKKTPKTLFFLSFPYFLLFFAMFFYIFSVAHMASLETSRPQKQTSFPFSALVILGPARSVLAPEYTLFVE